MRMRMRKSSCHRYILLHLPVMPPTVAMIVNHSLTQVDPSQHVRPFFFSPTQILFSFTTSIEQSDHISDSSRHTSMNSPRPVANHQPTHCSTI
ncbi:hypothetical protein BO99DRAFT_236041 [Aspergillus violaceofuscus CBS 115571]|uniref:Uncharacterized protein n=1 Tax=Aspergillus violaceofuscus (strain CBS 115571) TaxID=1450538 RepID=A0A2V5GXV0_ASPV1|nr:hypothetical protein BO99DRAFT_236041 [Aspergillus violaceofuscus CBS 115571]